MELVVAPIAELRPRLTHMFEELVSEVIERGEGHGAEPYTFACGLTGGSTALIFLGALREAAIDWSRVALFWGDERAVPPDHPDSNYGLAERLLLNPLGARAPRSFRMPADNEDLEAAARAYEEVLLRELAEVPVQGSKVLDLIILGVGDDGHVCSLFPGHRALLIEDRRVIAVEDSPKPPPRRLTLSLAFVCQTRHVWIVAVGPRKLPILQAAATRERYATPLDLVVRRARDVTVFTDQAIRQPG